MQQAASAPACRALLNDTHFTAMLAELAALSPLTDESDSAVERLNPLRDSMRRLSDSTTRLSGSTELTVEVSPKSELAEVEILPA